MTVIRGDHEFKVLEIDRYSNVHGTYPHVDACLNFTSKVATALDRVTRLPLESTDPRVVEAVVFIATRDDLNQVQIEYIQMQPSDKLLGQSVTSMDCLGWMAQDEDEATKLYSQFCHQCEILINEDEQTKNVNSFCFGDINNNFYIEQV